MFAKISILALAGAAAVSALDSRAVHEIVTRQLSESSVPASCQSTCSSALSIYNACLNGDTQTCLSVCQADTYSGFIGCFSCILDNTPGVTQSEVDQLNSAISQLQTACSAAGQTVSAASLTAPSGGSAESSGVTSSGLLASVTGVSFTSASGGLTITSGSASSSARFSATSQPIASAVSQSLASGASAVSGAAASATSSGAAGVAAHLPNFLGAAMGLVGVGAGAAFML